MIHNYKKIFIHPGIFLINILHFNLIKTTFFIFILFFFILIYLLQTMWLYLRILRPLNLMTSTSLALTTIRYKFMWSKDSIFEKKSTWQNCFVITSNWCNIYFLYSNISIFIFLDQKYVFSEKFSIKYNFMMLRKDWASNFYLFFSSFFRLFVCGKNKIFSIFFSFLFEFYLVSICLRGKCEIGWLNQWILQILTVVGSNPKNPITL